MEALGLIWDLLAQGLIHGALPRGRDRSRSPPGINPGDPGAAARRRDCRPEKELAGLSRAAVACIPTPCRSAVRPAPPCDVIAEGDAQAVTRHDETLCFAFEPVSPLTSVALSWKQGSCVQACLPCLPVDTSEALNTQNRNVDTEDDWEHSLCTVLYCADARGWKNHLDVVAQKVLETCACGPDTQIFTLRLCDFFPARTFDLTRQHFPVGIDFQEVMRLLQCQPVVLQQSLPDLIDLHPSTVEALSSINIAASSGGALSLMRLRSTRMALSMERSVLGPVSCCVSARGLWCRLDGLQTWFVWIRSRPSG